MSVICLRTFRDERTIQTYSAPAEVIINNHDRPEGIKPLARPRKPQERCASSGLKYFPRLNLWRGSNVKIDPVTLDAHSYNWWVMVRRFGQTLVLNSYRYSVMTSKHQRAARCWLRVRGFDFIEIESPEGLQDLRGAIPFYLNRIERLEALIKKKGARKAKNAERQAEILKHKGTIKTIKQLIKVQARKGGAA